MEYLTNSTPWPEKGDSIFSPPEDWRVNVCFHFTHDKLHLYANGYRYAAETLIDSILSEGEAKGNGDAKVYPILFLYHHHLELRLKEIIFRGNRLNHSSDDFPKHHRILDIWFEAKKLLLQLNENADKTPLNVVEKVIKELASVSNDAEGYRYPMDKNGNIHLKDIDILNLGVLKNTMDKVTSFFDAVETQVSVYLDTKNEIEAEYRNYE